MDLDDSLSLNAVELERGMGTILMTDDFFDCHLAVKTAFKFTKLFHLLKEEEQFLDDHEKGKDNDELYYTQFREFLERMKLFYIICKVNSFNFICRAF